MTVKLLVLFVLARSGQWMLYRDIVDALPFENPNTIRWALYNLWRWGWVDKRKTPGPDERPPGVTKYEYRATGLGRREMEAAWKRASAGERYVTYCQPGVSSPFRAGWRPPGEGFPARPKRWGEKRARG